MLLYFCYSLFVHNKLLRYYDLASLWLEAHVNIYNINQMYKIEMWSQMFQQIDFFSGFSAPSILQWTLVFY